MIKKMAVALVCVMALSAGVAQAQSMAKPDPKAVQTSLNAAGFSPGKIDGKMGKNTRAALKKFQASKGLKATGMVDAATAKALGM
jgi:peptidoglycan hydrolase-like protein with peptidoglycan-binding domain